MAIDYTCTYPNWYSFDCTLITYPLSSDRDLTQVAAISGKLLLVDQGGAAPDAGLSGLHLPGRTGLTAARGGPQRGHLQTVGRCRPQVHVHVLHVYHTEWHSLVYLHMYSEVV